MADRRTRILTIALATGVAVAFADSSIVVLALPDLYGEFDTTLVGVSWVISSYNLVVAVGAFCLVPFARRLRPRPTGIVGVAIFAVGSAGCAASWTLDILIGFRCLQALGGALLLAASLRASRRSRLYRPGCGRLDDGRHDRRRGRPGARRSAHAALRLAGDLRRAGAAGACCARGDDRCACPRPGAGSSGSGRQTARARGRHRPRARLRSACRGAIPFRPARDHRLVARPGGWGACGERAPGGNARRAPSCAPPGHPYRCARRRGAAGGRPRRPGDAASDLEPARGARARVLRRRPGSRSCADRRRARSTGPGDAERSHNRRRPPCGPRARACTHRAVAVGDLSGSDDKALLAGAQVVLEGDADLRQKVPIALDLRDALDEAKKGEIPDLAKPFDDGALPPTAACGRCATT